MKGRSATRCHARTVGGRPHVVAAVAGRPAVRLWRGLKRASPNRHLFAYLAQEVLEDLPEDLQDFVLRCSILLELNPTLCTALTDRNGLARACLNLCIAATCS